MGKSRSAAICTAYLLHLQPSTLTPENALAIIKQGRPLCEPNDGFMAQLGIYHEMGAPDTTVLDHPLYNRWLYRREVEGSVACGRAPEMSAVLFEDEQGGSGHVDGAKDTTREREREVKCRKCRYVSSSGFVGIDSEADYIAFSDATSQQLPS